MRLFNTTIVLIFAFALAFAGRADAVDDTSFAASFSDSGTVEETGSMSSSESSEWWVNSGGRLISDGDVGKTVQGALPSNDPWRLAYASSNPLDTDGGYHPQNIFRLVTRGRWRNFRQQAFFRITATNLSASPNRAGHNGILFFERYQSGDTLYYAGIRVDGAAVIKKKLNGTYTTLAYQKIYPGTYHLTNSPNLLPVGEWIGMRSEVETLPGDDVSIRLFVSDPSLGSGWTPVLDAVDTGSSSAAILNDGYAGVRTDFMDVELDDYEAAPLGAAPTATPAYTATPSPTPTPTPGSCSVSISPTSRTVPPDGASGMITVSAPSNCAWTATADQSWVVLDSPASGVGDGSVSYTVMPKSDSRKRSATIDVAGEIFRITQSAN